MLVVVVSVIILAIILEIISYKFAVDGIQYQITPSKTPVEPNETLDLVTVLENRSRLPKTFVEVCETVPDTLKLSKDTASTLSDTGREYSDAQSETAADKLVSSLGQGEDEISVKRQDSTIKSTLYLLPKQRLERRTAISFEKRGRYLFRGSTVSCGDFLGFKQKTKEFKFFKEVIVTPTRAESIELDKLLGGFMGDISVRRFLHEDPVLTIGFHEYTGTEPMKNISWIRSAKSDDELYVKSFDHTIEPCATVILNVEIQRTKRGRQSSDDAVMMIEKCYSVARTVCELMDSKGIKYSFITNARAVGSEKIWPDAVDGMGQNHLNAILEGLGRATHVAEESFAASLSKAAAHAQQGRSHIIITPQITPAQMPAVERLKLLSGTEVAVIETCSLEI